MTNLIPNILLVMGIDNFLSSLLDGRVVNNLTLLLKNGGNMNFLPRLFAARTHTFSHKVIGRDEHDIRGHTDQKSFSFPIAWLECRLEFKAMGQKRKLGKSMERSYCNFSPEEYYESPFELDLWIASCCWVGLIGSSCSNTPLQTYSSVVLSMVLVL